MPCTNTRGLPHINAFRRIMRADFVRIASPMPVLLHINPLAGDWKVFRRDKNDNRGGKLIRSWHFFVRGNIISRVEEILGLA